MCRKSGTGSGKDDNGIALRLIEMVLRDKDGEEVCELLKEHKVPEHRQVRLAGREVLVQGIRPAVQPPPSPIALMANKW